MKLQYQVALIASLLVASCGQPPSEEAVGGSEADITIKGAVEGLAGIEWVVEDIGGRGIVDRSRATILLDADGRISGRATCNRYTGNYEMDGEAFRTGDLAVTTMACAEALARQEAEFLRILRSASGISVTKDGALVISSPSGESLVARRE